MNHGDRTGTLDAIQVADARSFLIDLGWEERLGTDTHYRYRIVFEDGGWDEVVLPRSRSYPDFADRMGDLVHTLSSVYSKPEEHVLADLLAGNANGSFRYLVETSGRQGAIGVDLAIQMLNAHRDMSAAAYQEFLAVPGRRMGDGPLRFGSLGIGRGAMEGMRLGPVSEGGRAVRIMHPGGRLLPVPPRVLSSAGELVRCSVRRRVPDPELGISCDFVESLLGLWSEGVSGIEMGMDAYVVGDTPAPVGIPRWIFPRLERVAEMMAPGEDSEPRGFVGRVCSMCNADESADQSLFGIEYFDGGEGTSKATMLLDGAARRTASDAIREYGLVSLRGRLVGHGRSREIVDISDLRTVG